MSGTDLELSCVIVFISGPFNAVLIQLLPLTSSRSIQSE